MAVGVVPLRAVRLVHDEQPEVARREETAAQVVRHHLRAAGDHPQMMYAIYQDFLSDLAFDTDEMQYSLLIICFMDTPWERNRPKWMAPCLRSDEKHALLFVGCEYSMHLKSKANDLHRTTLPSLRIRMATSPVITIVCKSVRVIMNYF